MHEVMPIKSYKFGAILFSVVKLLNEMDIYTLPIFLNKG